ncbi:hypothetical protein HC928_15080 [bacterium]|nr:hypothetical protein [bacterium]
MTELYFTAHHTGGKLYHEARNDVPTMGMVPLVVNDLTMYVINPQPPDMPVRVLQVYSNTLYFDGGDQHGVLHVRVIHPPNAVPYWRHGSVLQMGTSPYRSCVITQKVAPPLLDLAMFVIDADYIPRAETKPLRVLTYGGRALHMLPAYVQSVTVEHHALTASSSGWEMCVRVVSDTGQSIAYTYFTNLEGGGWVVSHIVPAMPLLELL